jgi:hypothetical protein
MSSNSMARIEIDLRLKALARQLDKSNRNEVDI